MPDQDVDLLSKYNFAESGNDPKAWVANAYTALNRLESGKFGDTLPEVIQGMSTAVRKNSKQWQLATGQKKMNEYEQNVMKEIIQQMYLVKTGKVERPFSNKVYNFEAVEKYGMPKWAKTMKKVGKHGQHTYFEE